MDEDLTWALFAASLALGALSLWQSWRPRPFARPALIPWAGLLFVALTGLLTLGIHLLSLNGYGPGAS